MGMKGNLASLLQTDQWQGSQCPSGTKSQYDVWCSLNTYYGPGPVFT